MQVLFENYFTDFKLARYKIKSAYKYINKTWNILVVSLCTKCCKASVVAMKQNGLKLVQCCHQATLCKVQVSVVKTMLIMRTKNICSINENI